MSGENHFIIIIYCDWKKLLFYFALSFVSFCVCLCHPCIPQLPEGRSGFINIYPIVKQKRGQIEGNIILNRVLEHNFSFQITNRYTNQQLLLSVMFR